MKILHINCNFITTSLHKLLISELDKMNIDNVVYVPTYDKNLGIVDCGKNVIVSECFNKWDRICFNYKQNKIFSDIEKKIDIKSFDCIHAYTLFTDGNCARRLSQKYGIPYVVAIRDTDVNAFFKYMVHLRKLGERCMREASEVFFLSNSYRNTVFEKYIDKNEIKSLYSKTRIVPNGVDRFWLDNRYLKDSMCQNKEIRIIFVGQIIKRKNPLVLLDVADILNRLGFNVRVTYIGKPVDSRLVNKIMNNKYAEYLGTKSKEEILYQFRKNDILIVPSLTETFGLVYAEAMSQGLPVIYTQGQGFDTQFEEGIVGYHIAARDPNDIVSKVLKIKESYLKLSNNCYRLVERYNWKLIAETYNDIYIKTIYKIHSK